MLNLTNMAVCRHYVHINWSYVLLDTLKLNISMDITNGKPSIMVQFRNRLRHVEDSALGPVWYMSNSPETHLPRDRMKETYTLQKKEIHAGQQELELSFLKGSNIGPINEIGTLSKINHYGAIAYHFSVEYVEKLCL
jgi:hypothetical protein